MKTNTLIIICFMAFSLNLFAQNDASKSVKTFAQQDQSSNLATPSKTMQANFPDQFKLVADLGEDLNVFNELNDLGEDFFVTFQPQKAIGRCQTTSTHSIGKANKMQDDFYREWRTELGILIRQEPYKSVAQIF